MCSLWIKYSFMYLKWSKRWNNYCYWSSMWCWLLFKCIYSLYNIINIYCNMWFMSNRIYYMYFYM